MEQEVKVGDIVRDLLGHEWRVLRVENGGWRIQVELVAYPAQPVWMGRSDFKR